MQEATTRKRRPEEDPDKDDESPPKKIKDIIEDEDELDEDALLGNSDEDENLDDTGLTEKQNYNLEEEEFLLKDEVYGEERAGLPAESKGKEYVKGGEEYPKEEEYTGEEAFSDGDAFAEGGEEYVEGEGGEEYVEGAEEYVEGEGERETWNKEEGRKEKEGAEEDWQEEDGDEETWNEEGTHEQEEEASILDADMAAGHDEEDDTEQTIESTQDREETSKCEEERENEDGGRFRPSVMVSPRYLEDACGLGAHPMLNLNFITSRPYSKMNDAPGGLFRFTRALRKEDKEKSPRLKFFESVMPQVEGMTDDQFLEFQMEVLTTLKRFKKGNADA